MEEKDLDDVKAVIVVHMFGFPCDMDRIAEICGEKPIIEDFAQSMGAEYKGKRVGNFGEVSVTSFYATKLMTTGEGGAILTDDEEIKNKALFLRYNEACPSSYLLRNPGMEIREYEGIIPSNYRMTDLQAAIGIEQIKKLDIFNEKRRAFAGFYNEEFRGLGIKLAGEKPYGRHVYHRYSLLCRTEKERERLIKHMIKNRIEVGILYQKPLHLLLPRSFGYKEGDFPVAEDVSKRILSIPLHPSLTQLELEKVVDTVRVFFDGGV